MDADDLSYLPGRRTDDALCKEETHEIIGCAFEVLNELGHGLNEKVYENALVVEFKGRSMPFDQQRRFAVLYKQEPVGEFVPDLIVHGKVIVDTKNIENITKLQVGLILNFKHAKLQFERIVLTSRK